MEQITAEQAYLMSKEANPEPLSPPNKVIELINERIKVSCSDGRYRASLQSFDEYGNGVRGLGIYCSTSMLQRIKNYYEKFGFVYQEMNDRGNLLDAWLEWGKDADS
jgi:hypothetical protein